MALDDFSDLDSTPAPAASAHAPAIAAAPAPGKKPAPSEDEDLFDFPVLEMKFEPLAERKPAIAPAAAPVPIAAAAAAPAAAAPAKPAPKPVPAPTAPTPVATKPVAPKENAKSAPAEAKPGEKDVAKAAQLVQDIEQALVSDGKKRKRTLQLQGPSSATLLCIGLLLLTNVGGLFLVWRSTQSFQSSVSATNQQIVHALQVQSLTAGQGASSSGTSTQGSQHEPHVAQSGTAPLEAFERSTLEMAREEIQAGEFSSARKRLARLLAVADRIEADQREEIEAQAAFLVASTYRKQAETAREKSP